MYRLSINYIVTCKSLRIALIFLVWIIFSHKIDSMLTSHVEAPDTQWLMFASSGASSDAVNTSPVFLDGNFVASNDN